MTKTVTKKLAIFVGATNVPLNLVDRAEFRDLINELDCRYPVPGRSKINKEIDKLAIELRANVAALFHKSRLINICADIWSKKGMTASFMGVTDKLAIELRANVAALFHKSRLINICADIWSKKGMTASFMGVTAHFFTTDDHKRHNITIAVRRMPSPHTADAVAE